jgi:2-oxoisovalerate dehydrogenase E2 component (dihydrolipoyl transacylase)
MATTVTMPQLGESVTEGTLGRWLKQPGDRVERFESIAEVVSDKVTAEIPSPVEGIMGEHLVDEGAVVPVGQPICVIEEVAAPAAPPAGGAAPPVVPGPSVAPVPAGEEGGPVPSAPGTPRSGELPTAIGPSAGGLAGGGPLPPGASPSVRSGAVPPPEVWSPAAAGPPTQPSAPVASADAPEGVGETPPSVQVPTAPGDGRRLHVSPAVRMLAREHGVDLTQVRGTGLGGRITKKDLLDYVQRRDAGQVPSGVPTDVPAAVPPGVAGLAVGWAPASGVTSGLVQGPGAPAASATGAPSAPPPGSPSAAPSPPLPATEAPQVDTLVPLTPVRRAIAEHMVRSRRTSPHAWVMVEVDMSQAALLRQARRDDIRRRTGADLTYLPIVARAVVSALREHPTLNATWTDEGIVLRGAVHLGIAVALESNLIVPVVRNAERLNLEGLAVAIHDLVERARSNRLRVDDVQGGTFTLNNAGALGTVLSQAIINQPQAAICVMDAVVKRPVVVGDDALAIRPMMNLSVSFDHRINDGLQAARFLRRVKEILEHLEEHEASL